jgi:hypothetical protein
MKRDGRPAGQILQIWPSRKFVIVDPAECCFGCVSRLNSGGTSASRCLLNGGGGIIIVIIITSTDSRRLIRNACRLPAEPTSVASRPIVPMMIYKFVHDELSNRISIGRELVER